jgi:hypothetical protein
VGKFTGLEAGESILDRGALAQLSFWEASLSSDVGETSGAAKIAEA